MFKCDYSADWRLNCKRKDFGKIEGTGKETVRRWSHVSKNTELSCGLKLNV